jgi:GNAT superfamily N-acetyltransferase
MMAQGIEPNVSVNDIQGAPLIRSVAEVHLEAFADYFNARLGRHYAESVIGWFVRQPDCIAIAAIDQRGTVLGYAIGAPIGHGATLQRDLFWVSARNLVLRPWLVFDGRLWNIAKSRLRGLWGVQQTGPTVNLPGPVMSLVAVGVASSARREGLGFRLMQVFAERAANLQMRTLLLWVDEHRTGTRRFYEKCGWESCSRSVDGSAFYSKVLNTEEVNWDAGNGHECVNRLSSVPGHRNAAPVAVKRSADSGEAVASQ